MARLWMFTWRTYGTWLPGEEGFVGNYRPDASERRIENQYQRPTAAAQPHLVQYAASLLRSSPVLLSSTQAERVAEALREHAAFRSFTIDAIGVMTDHVHLLGWYETDPDPERALADCKAYASRAINKVEGKRTWWVEGGSKRWYPDEPRGELVDYVRKQERPLVIWLSEEVRRSLEPRAEATG